ncbi:ABC transporter substrate-binding protein [Sphaerotilus mobilis]|uniref:NitT/TauT family transport system substrate-binding protein n=1 Tax=Sphaerotilus mobilis TaxID=47994 RepID=A0A4Q7LHW7_9BURK|nr:ABC transporter substrate-binding protein [Sphaerotilus mobilis]RZS52949.1 NitT/TauT family transport system substrate-binding protein [Sphaerotilus mobilis]
MPLPTSQAVDDPARRHWLGRGLGAAAGLLALPGLSGCSRPEPLLRVASNNWPGYALMHAAQALGRFDPTRLRLIEMPSSSDVVQSLAAGTVEAGALTLDELLAARADGLDLVAVLVFDESRGGDAVVARPMVRDLTDLAGRRIGVEQSAVGALVLHATLRSAGLRLDQVRPVVMTVAEHVQAWREGLVDALVSFEPVVSQVMALGGKRLFDSRSMPGAIVDVLAVPRPVLAQHPRGLRQIAAAHFEMLALWQQDPQRLLPLLGEQLGLGPEAVRQAFEGLYLPDLALNRDWLTGETPKLTASASALVEVMQIGHMLPRPPALAGLASGLALEPR